MSLIHNQSENIYLSIENIHISLLFYTGTRDLSELMAADVNSIRLVEMVRDCPTPRLVPSFSTYTDVMNTDDKTGVIVIGVPGGDNLEE